MCSNKLGSASADSTSRWHLGRLDSCYVQIRLPSGRSRDNDMSLDMKDPDMSIESLERFRRAMTHITSIDTRSSKLNSYSVCSCSSYQNSGGFFFSFSFFCNVLQKREKEKKISPPKHYLRCIAPVLYYDFPKQPEFV